jgi:hypothetical protein
MVVRPSTLRLAAAANAAVGQRPGTGKPAAASYEGELSMKLYLPGTYQPDGALPSFIKPDRTTAGVSAFASGLKEAGGRASGSHLALPGAPIAALARDGDRRS